MVQQMHVQELAPLLATNKKVYLLDVRQPWEHQIAALPNSKLVPLNELPTRKDEIQPPKNALVVAYCHHGIRSVSAAAFLDEAGFKKVASLYGGIDAWSFLVDPTVPRY